MKKIFLRFCVIYFWVGILAAVLYFPKWKWTKLDKNEINVFAWGDILEPSVIADFEKKTGIKVHLNYYSSNEELLVKLKATGAEGYDLIVPSDYAVNLLREEGLLKRLDKSKLNFWKKLNPLLLEKSFDPQNLYSVPFEWEVYLLGINKDHFLIQPTASWKLIFDETVIDYKIAMVNDPREALQLAAFYLYGLTPALDQKQINGLQTLLMRQKKWIEAYASFRADYFLATRNCPVVVASSSYIVRTMRKYPFVGYLLPEEGTFLTIENLAIPAPSQKEELVYQLINHLFSESSIQKHFDTFGFFPSTFTHEADFLMKISAADFKKFHFTYELVSEQEMDKIWVEVKK